LVSTREYKKSEVELPDEVQESVSNFFQKMDQNGDGKIEREEAVAFWSSNFAKINAAAMFNEVDEDQDGSISEGEFRSFFANVFGSGYTTVELIEEISEMMCGSSWVDFDDGRTT